MTIPRILVKMVQSDDDDDGDDGNRNRGVSLLASDAATGRGRNNAGNPYHD